MSSWLGAEQSSQVKVQLIRSSHTCRADGISNCIPLLKPAHLGDTAMLSEDLYVMFLFVGSVLALDIAAIVLYRGAKP